jgi:hypothetical protein
MSDEFDIDGDIDCFFKDIKYGHERDAKHTLKTLLLKYAGAGLPEKKIDHQDLFDIIGSAKQKFASENLVVFLGQDRNKVAPVDMANLCVIEATIGHLNKIKCLRRLVKFDKREDKV